MNIRTEQLSEYDTIYQLIQTAFETAKVSDGNEQDFASDLRKKDGYIPELALVAEEDKKIIGHIMFTKMDVDTPNGPYPALLLAPLSVLFACRSRGVGSALIQEGFVRAKKMGYGAVFLAGDPVYYGRFGFVSTVNHNIVPVGFPAQVYPNIMVCELKEDALKGITGNANLH